MRVSLSGAPFPSELRDLLQHRLGDLESQLLNKVNELEEEKTQLYNETSVHRQRTENTLNTLINRISDLEKGIHSLLHCTYMKYYALYHVYALFIRSIHPQFSHCITIQFLCSHECIFDRKCMWQWKS